MAGPRGAALVIAAAAALAGCSKDAAAPAGPRDAVLAAWKAEQLAPAAALVPAKVAFAADCQTGAVGEIDVLLCNFASPAEAKAAEVAGLAWIGAATGASQAHGAALVVVADRKKADPSGRTINKLLKLAPN